MSPPDAPDAHLHENALAEDLTGASLLRTRIVEVTEKRVSNAEMRSETPSAAATPRSAPDAREPPPPSAKHESATRRPGAILRAAERLVLAAAVEDAAAGEEGGEGDGSHTHPPGSDDTQARFRASDVFDALFERERETFGETQELACLPAAKWWSSAVDPPFPEASDANADLAFASPRTWLGAPKERETFPPRLSAPPRAKAKAKAKKKGVVAAATLSAAATDEGMDEDADSELALSLARLRVATDEAKARARAAHTRLARNLSSHNSTTTDDARFFAALPGVGVCASLAERAFSTRLDARAAEARAALETHRRAYEARRDSPAGGSPLGRDVLRSFDETEERKTSRRDEPPGTALFKFNSQSKKTQPLRDFLVEHFDHPYPSDAQRERLARESGMSRAQVGNWFINARVRIWRPMILRLGEQIEEERRNAPTVPERGAARKGGQKQKRLTNRERFKAREGARGDQTAANA